MRPISAAAVLTILALLHTSSANVRHCILGKWNSNSSIEQQGNALDCLRMLPSSVPEILTYEVGIDLGVTAANWDWGLVGSFASVGTFEAYEASDPHQSCLALLALIMEEKAGLEFNASTAADVTTPYRHVILGKWTANSTTDLQKKALDCLKALPQTVPQIVTYEVGSDIGVTAGNWDWGLVGGFSSLASFEAYEASDPHKSCLALLAPIMKEKAGLEFNASTSIHIV